VELKRRVHNVQISGPFHGRRRYRDDPDVKAQVPRAESLHEADRLPMELGALLSPALFEPTLPSFDEWLTTVTHMAEALLAIKRQLMEERDLVSALVLRQRELLEVVLPARMAELKRAQFVIQTGLALQNCLRNERQELQGTVLALPALQCG
jgi:hypothetical protein